MKDIIIIGAGAVGSLIARALSQYQAEILVIEKETDVGDVTSMANSAIVHSGYDPVPGTKKAIFNVKGNAMFPALCRDLDVNFGPVGSLTIALEDSQLATLKELQIRGAANGVKTELLSAEQVKKMEPNIAPTVKGALLCPTAGVVNPFTLTSHAMECAIDNGAELHLEEEVTGISPEGDHFVVKTNKAAYEARAVINAAGLHSDQIAAMIEPISWSIHPRKGEYYVLDHYGFGLVNHVLFPLPSDKGKGILVTMTTSFNYLVGPSSEFTDSTDDFSTDSLTLADVKRQAVQMVPSIPFNQQIRVFAGLRATPSTHDFIIEPSKIYPNFINVAGIESPGLVSSPAIAEYVAETLVQPRLHLQKKETWNPKVRPYIKPSALSPEARAELIKKDPRYGQIICNCEQISLGEIMDALSRSLPCLTVKALKKRTRAGFGKCQGGFCQPHVVMLLADYFHVSPLEILYDKEGSHILAKESKR